MRHGLKMILIGNGCLTIMTKINMRKITVEITLNDEWESYFDYDTYTCDSLIIEDLFEGMRKDGIENIELVSRGFKYYKTVKNENNNRRD